MEVTWAPKWIRITIATIRIGCVVILLIAAENSQAQGYFHDYEQWFSLKVSDQPGKKWSVSGQYTLRNYGFVEAFKGSYYYLQGLYALNKHWYPDVLLRAHNTYFVDAFRLEVGMQYRLKSHKNTTYLRVAYYNEREHLLPDDRLLNPPDNYVRERLRYRRDLPKGTIGYASIESWIKFDPGFVYLKRWAFVVGIDREVFDHHHVSIEYLYQVEYDKKFPVALQSVALGYEYSFYKLRYHRKGKGDNRDDR